MKNIWKPGQLGNPAGGRTKGLSDQVKKFLTKKVPNDPQGRMYLEKLVENMVKRAIKKSDVLVKEIVDRVEGKVPNDPAEAAQYGVKIIIADIPGPPGEFNQFIDVVPPKHHHGNGDPPAKKLEADNGSKRRKLIPSRKTKCGPRCRFQQSECAVWRYLPQIPCMTKSNQTQPSKKYKWSPTPRTSKLGLYGEAAGTRHLLY